MNAAVHYTLTRRLAIRAGFDEADAETIARANRDTDREFSGKRWRNKQYHFAWLGARRRSRDFLDVAIADGDLVALGRALHCMQDAVGHGHLGHLWHWPGIDLIERRSDRARANLERATTTLLAEYQAGRYNTG